MEGANDTGYKRQKNYVQDETSCTGRNFFAGGQ